MIEINTSKEGFNLIGNLIMKEYGEKSCLASGFEHLELKWGRYEVPFYGTVKINISE
jgi:hypothetical protein